MAETQYVLSQTKQGKKEWIPLPTGGVAAHNQAWSTITDTPTTLLGYGITDGGSMEWPGAGIPLSTGASPWGTSYTTSGSGTVIALTASPTFTGTVTVAALIVEDLTDGYIPYQKAADDKLSNSPLYTDGTNIGIGVTTLNSNFSFPASVGSKINFYDNGSIDYGIGIQNNLLQIYCDTATDRVGIGYGRTGSFTETLTVKGARVGIGTAAPDFLLTVGDDTTAADMIASINGPENRQKGLALTSAGTTKWYMYNPVSSADLRFFNGSTDKMILSSTGRLSLDGGLHIGGTSDPGDNNLWIDGNAQEPSFAEGWQGTNWRIEADGDAEFNNVRIRGGLSVYELIINQLHYQNGGLIIGAGAGKIATITTSTVGSEVLTFHDPEGNDMVPFTAGSIVMCQRVDISKTVANGYTGDVVKKIVRQVASVSGMEVTLTTTTGWLVGADTGIFEIGDEICAVGHTSNTALDSSIYLSATDTDNPFIRVLDGVSTYGKWSLGDKTTIKLQLGNLASLASYDILPASPGYGLYCNNVYLTGKMVLPTAGMTDEGSGASDIRIYAGDSYANRATAPFRVTQNGALTATGIAELGTSVDIYGGNIAIKDSHIYGTSGASDAVELSINYKGYQGGTTYTRNTNIYDGKNNPIIKCIGGDKSIQIPSNGGVVIGSTSPATSGLLDLQSTDKALIVPRMTETQANAMTKVAGMIVYMTDLGHFYGYTNAWRILD